MRQTLKQPCEIKEDAVASVLGLLKGLSPTGWLADGAPIELCFKDTDFCRVQRQEAARYWYVLVPKAERLSVQEL